MTSAVNQTAAAAIAGTGATAAASKTKAVDQQAFMNLLVEQLKNQDPLNPMDSANFTAQLATFSSLEQLTQIKQGIDKLTGAQDGGTESAFQYLGREIEAKSDLISVSGGKASEITVDAPQAGQAEVRIFDAKGKQVYRDDLGELAAGKAKFDSARLLGDHALPDGEYRIEVRVTTGKGQSVQAETAISGRVTGVELGSDGPMLLVGERQVAISEVRQVRSSESTAA